MSKIEELRSLGVYNLEELRGFHNAVYKGSYKEKKIVIRVSNRRNLEELAEEVRILNQIKDKVAIAAPVKVEDHYVLERKGEVYSFFEEIEGKNWFETSLTEETHMQAGKELGKLHLAMQEVAQPKRATYADHPDLALLDDGKELYKQRLKELLSRLEFQAKSKDAYGLIHGDYLFSNLLYHEPEVSIIDFDDMEMNYYLYDIAVYHFYLLLGGNPASMDIEPNIKVFSAFMKGYRSVNKKTKLDFQLMQDMFRLRQLKLLATITQKFDQDKLGDWQKNYLDVTNNQLGEDQDFIDIDYHALYQSLDLE